MSTNMKNYKYFFAKKSSAMFPDKKKATLMYHSLLMALV